MAKVVANHINTVEKGKASCYLCKKMAKKESAFQCIIFSNYMHIKCVNMPTYETFPICPISSLKKLLKK